MTPSLVSVWLLLSVQPERNNANACNGLNIQVLLLLRVNNSLFLETFHKVGFRGSRLVVSVFFTTISPQSFITKHNKINSHLISRSRNSYNTNIEIFLSDPSLVIVFPFHSFTNCCSVHLTNANLALDDVNRKL